MAFPEIDSVLSLFEKTIHGGVLEYLEKQAKPRRRRGIYTLGMVFWLMMLQRLLQAASQATVVQYLAQGAGGTLLADCKRVRERKISLRTGGYCQGRQKMPKIWVKQMSDEIPERLRAQLNEPWPGLEEPMFLLDGSSLELEHCPELLKAYPPWSNGDQQGHWPVLKVVVMHDAGSGLAQTPCWGPMYGPEAVSEQALAEAAMERLPARAVILADCNFGIFSTAYSAYQRQHPVVLRLTKARALRLAGQPLSRAGARAVEWKPSRWDKPKSMVWPAEATVPGRLIAARIGRGKSKQWLYLFTTLKLAWTEVVELYGQRWIIETDLRSLKRTVSLHHIAARSVAMLEKELLVAMSAYNLVRAVMCLAARRAQLHPRQLSFSFVLHLVDCSWPRLMNAPTKAQHDREFERMLDLAAGYQMPKRHKRRSYAREQWRHGEKFPYRKAPHAPIKN